LGFAPLLHIFPSKKRGFCVTFKTDETKSFTGYDSLETQTRRMPLVIEGARQVGKTWLMKEFGRGEYRQTVYINFDADNAVKEIFHGDINPHSIIEELEFFAGFKIIPGETLIIFDEIQVCNRALVSLKYFCEEAPEYDIVSAGSMLGVAIHIKAKASLNLKAKSLKAYMDYYSPPAAIRTSLSRYGRNGNLYDIPLYLIGAFERIPRAR
jgi:predicted AAA+ superfamily ATPase